MKDIGTKKFVFEKVDPSKRLLNYPGNNRLSRTDSGWMTKMATTPKALEELRWKRVQTWINTCSTSHSICRIRGSSSSVFLLELFTSRLALWH